MERSTEGPQNTSLSTWAWAGKRCTRNKQHYDHFVTVSMRSPSNVTKRGRTPYRTRENHSASAVHLFLETEVSTNSEAGHQRPQIIVPLPKSRSTAEILFEALKLTEDFFSEEDGNEKQDEIPQDGLHAKDIM